VITLEEAAAGKEVQIEIPRNETCDVCKGTGSTSGTKPAVCPVCNGTGQVRQTQGFFSITQTCYKCRGEGTIITSPCKTCGGTGLKVKKTDDHRQGAARCRVGIPSQDNR